MESDYLESNISVNLLKKWTRIEYEKLGRLVVSSLMDDKNKVEFGDNDMVFSIRQCVIHGS